MNIYFKSFNFTHLVLDDMGSQGEGHIKENSALSAHILLVGSRASNTRGSVHGGRVNAALGLGLPLQLNVATLTPGGAPAVPDQPVVALGGVCSVSDQLDGVVQADVLVEGAACEHAAPVGAPAPCINCNGQGANVGQVIHGGGLVVRHGVVAGDANGGGGVVDVVQAVLGGHGLSGYISKYNKFVKY